MTIINLTGKSSAPEILTRSILYLSCTGKLLCRIFNTHHHLSRATTVAIQTLRGENEKTPCFPSNKQWYGRPRLCHHLPPLKPKSKATRASFSSRRTQTDP
ncbi:unnamed protein product [Ectocarpus sp. 12 AP-2014]